MAHRNPDPSSACHSKRKAQIPGLPSFCSNNETASFFKLFPLILSVLGIVINGRHGRAGKEGGTTKYEVVVVEGNANAEVAEVRKSDSD